MAAAALVNPGAIQPMQDQLFGISVLECSLSFCLVHVPFQKQLFHTNMFDGHVLLGYVGARIR